MDLHNQGSHIGSHMISHMDMSHDHHGKVVHRPSKIDISSVLKSSGNFNEFSLSTLIKSVRLTLTLTWVHYTRTRLSLLALDLLGPEQFLFSSLSRCVIDSDHSQPPYSRATGLSGLTRKFRPWRWTVGTIPECTHRPDLTTGGA